MNKGRKHHTKKGPYEGRNYAKDYTKDYMYMKDFMKQGGKEGRKEGSMVDLGAFIRRQGLFLGWCCLSRLIKET